MCQYGKLRNLLYLQGEGLGFKDIFNCKRQVSVKNVWYSLEQTLTCYWRIRHHLI